VASPLTLQKLGGSYQLVVSGPDDLAHIQTLDEALWMATAIPAEGLTCDPVFLGHVDTNGDGRIRSDEIRAAQNWLFGVLRERSRVGLADSALLLSAIDDSSEEGLALLAAARRVLANLDLREAGEITLQQVRDRKTLVAGGASNGDGVIPPAAARKPELRGFIEDVITAVGGVEDVNGEIGVNRDKLKEFISGAMAHLAWIDRGRIPEGEQATEVMPWGPDTVEAYAPLQTLWEPVDEFYAISSLAALDARLTERPLLDDGQLAALNKADPAAIKEIAAAAPLARPSPEGILDFETPINAHYAKAVDGLRHKVLFRLPTRDRNQLTRESWEEIKNTFAAHRQWQSAKVGGAFEKLGEDRLRAYLDGDLPARLRKMISADEAVAMELEQVRNLEKLLLYQQWLMELVNNSVSFPRFYDPTQRSMVEVGTLVMDGRRFTLAVRVLDRKAHKQIAVNSHICVMYLEISSRRGEATETFEAAVAVTSGNTTRLCVGKKGVFFTKDGREWDATVAEVISNPVSLGEAVKHPFRKLAEFVARQWEKLTSSLYTQTEKSLGGAMDSAGKQLQAPPPAASANPNPTSKSGATRDLLVGGGFAIAALGGVFAYVTKTLSQVKPVHVIAVLLGVLALIIVPAAVAAIFKLRRRNLSMILEACGWAMNAPMHLTRRIGRLFTSVPPAPAGTVYRRNDMVSSLLRKMPGRSHRFLAWFLGLLLAIVLGCALGHALAPRFERHLLGLLGLQEHMKDTGRPAAEPKSGTHGNSSPATPSKGQPGGN